MKSKVHTNVAPNNIVANTLVNDMLYHTNFNKHSKPINNHAGCNINGTTLHHNLPFYGENMNAAISDVDNSRGNDTPYSQEFRLELDSHANMPVVG